MKTYIRLAIVLALALVSWWFQDFLQDTPIIKPAADEHFPDYFMENFAITSMNKKGQPTYILKAQRLQHFADDDSAEIFLPIIDFKEVNGKLIITANKATILKDKNIIHLYENVNIQRTLLKSGKPLNISTHYLKVDTKNKIAETDQQAHIKSQNFELDTLGMVFKASQGILELKSKVKGIYETAQ